MTKEEERNKREKDYINNLEKRIINAIKSDMDCVVVDDRYDVSKVYAQFPFLTFTLGGPILSWQLKK